MTSRTPLVVLLATLIVKTPPVGLQSVGQFSPTMAFREEDPDESAQRQVRLSLPESLIQARRQVERLQADLLGRFSGPPRPGRANGGGGSEHRWGLPF